MAHQSTGSLPLPVNSRVTMLVELPRRVALWISLLAIGLASLLDACAASAGTLVEFPNLPGASAHARAPLRRGACGLARRPQRGLSGEAHFCRETIGQRMRRE